MLILTTRGNLKKYKKMFRKIVSNLSFSPALVGQLGFYAKRLRKEETTRRMGLVFVALALVVQSLVVFQPPESANASNPSDFVPGGLGLGSNRSLNNFLRPYDANSKHLKDIMNHFGITRAEITSAKFSSFMTSSKKLSWGHVARPGSTPVKVKGSDGSNITTVHGRPINIANGNNTRIYGWIGQSKSMGWFAIMQYCGNLVTEKLPPTPVPPKVIPPPEAPEPAEITLSKSTKNFTQGNIDATTSTARADDRISFTITAKNTGGSSEEVELVDNLGDVLEYSELIDQGGGTYNETTQDLSWPDITLGPGATESRTFTVQVKSTIPATAQGQSDPSSYNCKIENVFGTVSVTVPVDCTPPKVVEEIVTELPKTGPTENIIFGGTLLAVVAFFYFRSRQLGKEVRLIRRDLNTGTI
jgi:hypothetical protein